MLQRIMLGGEHRLQAVSFFQEALLHRLPTASLRSAALHHEILQYYLSTGRVPTQVPHNLAVPCLILCCTRCMHPPFMGSSSTDKSGREGCIMSHEFSRASSQV